MSKLIVEIELENLRECEDICREFVHRVELGEIRSTYTYGRCKSVVKKIDMLAGFIK